MSGRKMSTADLAAAAERGMGSEEAKIADMLGDALAVSNGAHVLDVGPVDVAIVAGKLVAIALDSGDEYDVAIVVSRRGNG